MRLTANQRQVLTQADRDCFEQEVRVCFGSRTDDTRKGGYIDLFD